MNLTYEEQERLAYISGDVRTAALLGELSDSENDDDPISLKEWIEELKAEVADLEAPISRLRRMLK